MQGDIIGKEFLSRSGHRFIVKSQKGLTNSRHKLFECYFPETGYTNFATKQKVKNGSVYCGKLKTRLSKSKVVEIKTGKEVDIEQLSIARDLSIKFNNLYSQIETSDLYEHLSKLPNFDKLLVGEGAVHFNFFDRSTKKPCLKNVWIVPLEFKKKKYDRLIYKSDGVVGMSYRFLAEKYGVSGRSIATWIKKGVPVKRTEVDISIVDFGSQEAVDFLSEKYPGWSWDRDDVLEHPTVKIVESDDKVETQSKLVYALKRRWKMMMARCYNPNATHYQSYGGSGVTVCDRWHNVENFVEDCLKFPNVEKVEKENYQIDKDIFSQGTNRIYCPEQCNFVPAEVNLFYSHARKSYLLDGVFYATRPMVAEHFGITSPSIEEWFNGVHKPHQKHNFGKLEEVSPYSQKTREYWQNKFPNWIPPKSFCEEGELFIFTGRFVEPKNPL